jgi:pimeloyl-ACP methyl ester carboxylesterase
MNTVRSTDGTAIAYDVIGSGPLLVLVDGALCSRTMGPGNGLSRLLSKDFTMIHYDRRGRGDSGDAAEYAIDREVEDLKAVIGTVGGRAFVFGQSSGAVLALHAAARLSQIVQLAAYEAPFVVDETRAPTGREYEAKLNELLADGRRGPAVRLFLELVGLPTVVIRGMQLSPIWPRLKAMAHTLPYDAEITVKHQQGQPLPPDLWAGVTQRTLAMCGGDSGAWMQNGMQALAHALPNATYRSLEGQTHNLRPKAVAPELTRFFAS